MDFWKYFYCLPIILATQSLAFSPRNFRSSSQLIPADTDIEFRRGIPEVSFEKNQGPKPVVVDKKTMLPRERKLLKHSQDWTRWPSKVDSFDTLNNVISEDKSTFLKAKGKTDARKSMTFQQLENQNANIYNPYLNLDRSPVVGKKYTFEELENMNANQMNFYLE